MEGDVQFGTALRVILHTVDFGENEVGVFRLCRAVWYSCSYHPCCHWRALTRYRAHSRCRADSCSPQLLQLILPDF